MKKFQKLSATAILTLAVTGSAFAGNISGDNPRDENISGDRAVSGNISGDNIRDGNISGDSANDGNISGDRSVALQQTVQTVLRALGLM